MDRKRPNLGLFDHYRLSPTIMAFCIGTVIIVYDKVSDLCANILRKITEKNRKPC